MSKLRQTAAGGGKLLSLVALAIIVLGCATPAHADRISISFDTPNATLRGSGKYLRYRNVITIDNSNSYGFTLKMYAKNPDLVNSIDSNYVINSVSGHNQYLAANQWGYSMTGDSGTFNEIPSSSYNAAVLADVTNNAKGVCDNISYCGVPITFGANIEPKKSVSGYYSTTLTYTVTSKPKPYVPPTPEPYVPPTPPVPPVPEPPKWTTNGCKSLSASIIGDNCQFGYYDSVYLSSLVGWNGNVWTNRSEYDYSNGRWALTASRLLYYGKDKELRVKAYIPRFAKHGYYIRFCKDSISTGCTDSDVEPAFAGGRLGFWISLTRLGCTEHVLDYASAEDKSYNAYNAAKTLAEALGSPCP